MQRLVTTSAPKVLRSDVMPPKQKLWYISDDRIRTETAQRSAAQVADWTRTHQGLETEPDEHDLFAALHTCAFNEGRHAQGQCFDVIAQENWYKRWHSIREFLVNNNLGLVYLALWRFRVPSLDEDELLSEAMCSLGRAIDRFDPWKGFRFSTYACNIISRTLWRRGKVESRYRNLFPVQHDSGCEKAADSGDVNKELYLERLKRALDGNLGELSELEATVLLHRFFPSDRERAWTFLEIGILVSLSKERVRQIQNDALNKLRGVLQADPILQ